LPEKFEYIFQSWDTANKVAELNDFSACTTWGVYKKHLYLLHVLSRKLEFPDLKRLVCSHAKEWSASDVLIEDKASGTQLVQDLKREGFSHVTAYSSTLDKHMRLVSVTPTFENGFVHLPDRAPFLADYKHQLLMFPGGRHDDQVDSTSQALDWYRSKREQVYGWLEYCKQQDQLAEPGKPNPTMFMRPRGGPGRKN
jgi:predicted phage terminase large subunit-like protein